LLLIVAALAAISSLQRESDSGQPASSKTLLGTVTRIVDGDTIKVAIEGEPLTTVRYIGVDTPETVKPGEPVQCFGKVASAYNRRLVEHKQVRLRVGRERLDRYDRLLAYVYLRPGGEFVNELLIERGYARTLSIAPNTDFAARFARRQRAAQRNGLGLWRACPDAESR